MDADVPQSVREELWAHRESFDKMSIDSRTARNQDPKFQLHLLQRRVIPSSRPIFPSTKCQRLSFYRTYQASSCTTEMFAYINIVQVCLMLAVVLIYMPAVFTYVFLASYSPEQHMFLDKMVPIFYGIKFLWVFTGFYQVIKYVNMLSIYLNYYAFGIFFKNPWNRCDSESSFDKLRNTTIFCYGMQEFMTKFINKSVGYNDYAYVSSNETFLVSQIDYYRKHGFRNSENNLQYYMYCLIICFLMAGLQNFITTELFWKILNWCQWAVNAVDFITYVYVIWMLHLLKQKPLHQTYGVPEDPNVYWHSNMDRFLLNSMAAPPVVHILTARSTQEIHPGQDSSTIIISYSVLYFFRGLLNTKMKQLCEKHLLQVNIRLIDYRQSYFFLWPMFYSTFFLGNIYTLTFFGLNFVSELLSAVVVYRCFMEMIVYEWYIPRDILKILFVVIVPLALLLVDFESHLSIFITCTIVALFMELFIILFVYPLGRLVEDFSFHYGQAPSKLKRWILKLVPYYFILVLYVTKKLLCQVLNVLTKRNKVLFYLHHWLWLFCLVPVFLGAVYKLLVHVFYHKMPFCHLFKPIQSWGPTDFSLRQLRKQFNRKTYIESEAPKYLSRYMIEKRETKMYKLDVRYDFTNKSAPHPMEVRFQNEKKKRKHDN